MVRLRKDTKVHRHRYRGELWYVLEDRVTGKFMRFSPEAYQLVGRMDGRRSVREIYEEAKRGLQDKMPSQREVVALVGQLYRANVLLTDQAPNVGSIEARARTAKSKQLAKQLMMPLAIRVPIWDPERFLQRTHWVGRSIYSVFGFAVWGAMVLTGIILAQLHWPALTANVSDRVLATENLLLMALVYPLVKAFHELGHAYAVKRFGGEVHEIGLMMLAFYPVPYVDASAASAFRSKYERMIVGLAGILVEVLLAALAMIVWAMAEPGVVRAICMNVMIISGVSTVLFNGNPLLRFDAYYVLTDAIEVPNLGSRGTQYVGYALKRLLGIRTAVNPSASAGEAAWLGGYAVLSFAYRILVMIAISLVIASKYLFVGVLLAMWSLYLLIVHPTLKLVSLPMRDPSLRVHARRLYLVGGGAVASVLLIIFALPLPYATRLDGVVWVKAEAVLRTDGGGEVAEVLTPSGRFVAAGDAILRLSNPDIEADLALAQARLAEAEQNYQESLQLPTAAEVMRQRVELYRSEADKTEREWQNLTVTADVEGTVILPNEGDLLGQIVARGTRVGFVTSSAVLTVQVPVLEHAIERVLQDQAAVEVRFVSEPSDVYIAEIARAIPEATKTLPSPILSLEGGGKLALDPAADDTVTAFQEFFLVELVIEDMPLRPIEERALILVRHNAEPIGFRWGRAVRRAFLRQFDV